MERMRQPFLLFLLAACTADEAPRIISTSLVRDTPDAHGPYRISAVIQDERKVDRATVFFITDGTKVVDTATVSSVEMGSEDGEHWTAEMPGLALGTVVTWTVSAIDSNDHLALSPSLPGGNRFV